MSIVLVTFVSACATATTAPSAAPTEAPVTAVQKLTDDQRFEQMIHTHVAERRGAIDECYLSEMLAGRGQGFASYELRIGVRPGTNRPLVQTVSTTDPEQRVLEHCVRTALMEEELPRRELTPQPVKIRIDEPDWLLDG
jgi:hypothetical protein